MFALEKCYTLNSISEKITVDVSKDGFRLPTDCEWQFACRGGEKGYRYGDIDEIAWFEENSNGRLHQVKIKKSNNFGLFDMIGNVWEWCFDWYDNIEAGEVTDPQGAASGSDRVGRGGCWSDSAKGCVVGLRRYCGPFISLGNLGFRVAMSKN